MRLSQKKLSSRKLKILKVLMKGGRTNLTKKEEITRFDTAPYNSFFL